MIAKKPLITIDSQPDLKDIQFLDEQLTEFNFGTTGIRDGEWLSSFVCDQSGQIVAGIHGWTWGGTCEIRFLWVRQDLRGEGLGSALLEAAEQEAVRRGCQQLMLSTHSFQAPEFYKKRGYQVIGVCPEYPKGHSQIYLRKDLEDVNNELP